MMHFTFRHLLKLSVIGCIFGLQCSSAFANQFNLPSSNNALIGDVSYISSGNGESVVSLAQRNNVGVNAVLDANPGLPDKTQLVPGTPLKIPAKFLLPPYPRNGIVINLAEMRMYYYPGNQSVMTFPIGIGKVGKTIPMGRASITRKVVNPTWIPPEDIRQFNRDQGIELPKMMGPGPDNPLGPYAIYLTVPTYLIHSTIFPESIGRRASFGCIRMHESDIKQFFPLVTPGTPVVIVNMPTKVAWEGSTLYLETHPPLEEHADNGINSLVSTIGQSVSAHPNTLIDWQLVSYLNDQRDGIPHEIGFEAH